MFEDLERIRDARLLDYTHWLIRQAIRPFRPGVLFIFKNDTPEGPEIAAQIERFKGRSFVVKPNPFEMDLTNPYAIAELIGEEVAEYFASIYVEPEDHITLGVD